MKCILNTGHVISNGLKRVLSKSILSLNDAFLLLNAYRHPTLDKRETHIPFDEGERGEGKIIFLEILGTVESFLRQLPALIRYSLPVRLTHHKADRALSIRFLLLFEISPTDLDKATTARCYDGEVDGRTVTSS